jgi:hypothetical protein
MDDWVDPRQPYRGRKSLYREQYNALGKRNLAAIERIVTSKYQRGPAFNRQYPFVDVLLFDITESGEVLDACELVRSPETDVASRAWPQGSLMLRNSRHPQKARTFESTSITQNSKRESKIALRHFEPAAKPRQLADFGPGRT